MPAGNNPQSVASQAEYLRPELEKLILLSSVLWKRIEVRTDFKAISTRPARIPFMPSSGGLFRTGGFDGQDMGRGSGLQEVPGYLSCVPFLQATEYTALSEWATDSDSKAIANYVTENQSLATKTFAGYLDALAANSDGSNTLDSVVSTTTDGLVVNNADIFQDNMYIDVWSALSGTFRGTVQIQSVDIANNTLWLTTAYPAGTIAGDLLLVNGSSGVANSGFNGLLSYQVAGNSGNYMGVMRSAWPGKFSTPNINLGGKALTPAVVRAVQAQQILALGEDNDGKTNVAHCNVDMQSAWENNSLLVQTVIANQLRGDRSVDMLPKAPMKMIAGREILLNVRALTGRIDFLNLKHWFRLETKASDYYEVGGQTIFPAYGASGGLASSNLFYLVILCQLGNGQPRAGAYLNNAAIPTNYFGH